MVVDKNDAAFPQPCTVDGFASNNQFGYAGGGLTKRELFSAVAMQGLLVNVGRNSLTFENVADEATKQADALIKALNK